MVQRLKIFIRIVYRIYISFFQPKISLLVPLSRNNDAMRKKTLKWLRQYWKYELPHAQIVVGYSDSKVFCKAEALNDAYKKAKGKVIVIMDADAYISGRIINECATRILEEKDNHLWYVPYRHLYRLSETITNLIINSNPKNPLRLPSPVPFDFIDKKVYNINTKYGHRYGAMCMMFPREAIDILGGFDERFKGWGGEDVALLRALDTLYGKHKTMNNDILHLWHPYIGRNYMTRRWENQEKDNNNANLTNDYYKATRNPSQMRKLVDEGNKNK